MMPCDIVTFVSIVSGNGFSPFQFQAIISTNVDFFSIKPIGFFAITYP